MKNEINDFHIVCKQHRIEVPDIRIDQRELKGLDLKLPSAIEEFKKERGIEFGPVGQEEGKKKSEGEGTRRERRKGEAIVSLKQQGTGKQAKSHKFSQGVRELNTKPLDLTTQVGYKKAN